MKYLIVFLLAVFVEGQKPKAAAALYVVGKTNETFRVDGFSSHNNYMIKRKKLLSDEIIKTFNFALKYTDKLPAKLLTKTGPDKIILLQLLHSFSQNNDSFVDLMLTLANLTTFSNSNDTKNFVDIFKFPNESIYQAIKYISISKPVMQKYISDFFFFLNTKSNVFQEAAIKGDSDIVKWLLENNPINYNAHNVEKEQVNDIWKNGKVEIIRLLMKHDKINRQNLPIGIVNEIYKNNETLLHIASRFGYMNAVNLLISLRVNVSSRDILGKTPLFRAVEHDRPEIIKILVNNGTDLNGEPLLALAIQKDNTNTVKTLINLGVELDIADENGNQPFFLAVKKNNRKVLEILASLDDPKRSVLNFTNDLGDTIVHIAAYNGFLDSFQNLHTLGAPIDSKNSLGETPLYKAVEGKHLGMIQLLLSMISTVDFKTRTYSGDTILHYASSLGSHEMIKLLLKEKKYFPINQKNFRGETPLYKAALTGNCTLLKFLVQNGGDLNIKNNGMTMLHEAATHGYEKAVKCLIETGLNVNVLGLWDTTPLHLAVSHGQERIVRQLLEYNANPNTKLSKNLWTPLHRAVLNDNVNIIKLLLENKADMNARNGANDTCCSLALKTQRTKAVDTINLITNSMCVS